MQKFNLNDLIAYDDKKFHPQVLINELGYRMVLMSMRAGQSIPEHSNPGRVTVYAVHGHITFYDGSTPNDIRTGEVITIESAHPHHLDAHEDSALLVLATAAVSAGKKESEELDLRQVPRPERHPMVFSRIDSLAVGESFLLINDHDPVPLNMQIQNLKPGEISWEYTNREPGQFRIRVKRISSPETAKILAGAAPGNH